MGFKKPTLENAYSVIRSSLGEIHSPYNDGWTAGACKQELYVLKCWLEDEFKKLPTFVGEEKWEQDRLVELLKK
jgi:hypothetical protein